MKLAISVTGITEMFYEKLKDDFVVVGYFGHTTNQSTFASKFLETHKLKDGP